MMRYLSATSYGGWALVAGAALGIGAAFTEELARSGFNIIAIDVNQDALGAIQDHVSTKYHVTLEPWLHDIANPLPESLKDLIESKSPGFLVYNAARSHIGRFDQLSSIDIENMISINCLGPAQLTCLLLPSMLKRKQGAIVLMSSLSAFHGSSKISLYAATKAFNQNFAEGLWHELQGTGVDVLACAAGTTMTPTFISTKPSQTRWLPVSKPSEVAAMRQLGNGPSIIPGLRNQIAQFIMQLCLPRKLASKLMHLGTTALCPD